MGVNTDGRREVLGVEIGTSEAEPMWTEFLRKLTRHGIRGVKLVVSDAHERLKAAVVASSRPSSPPPSPRRRRKPQVLSGEPANQIRPKLPKLAAILDAEPDVLAYCAMQS